MYRKNKTNYHFNIYVTLLKYSYFKINSKKTGITEKPKKNGIFSKPETKF